VPLRLWVFRTGEASLPVPRRNDLPAGFCTGQHIFARRLLIFLVPFYAFGLAYFLVWFSERKFLDNLPPTIRQWGIIGLAVFIIAVNSAKAATVAITPKATSYQVSLAKSAGDNAKPNAMLWNWWDQGYFLAFYAERRTIMDGGNQRPDLMFIAALPLTVNDPVLAANWIKFFAARGTNAYRSINRHFHNLPKTIEFLKKALSEKEPLDSLLERYKLGQDERYWRNYLFPKAEVYLYLNHELFEKAPWWFYFGSGEGPSRPGTRPKASFFGPGQFAIDARTGDIAFEDRLMSLSALYLSKLQPIPRVVAHRTFEGQKGPAALWVRDLDMSYLFDNAMEDSLFMKLLLFDPYSPPKGFELVKYVPLQGGLWRVR